MAEETASAALTLKDIARQAGVSLATVDRVLHNRPGVRPDTVRRVKEAIERNAFQPHVAAAELARGRARRFAFVMPTGPNPFMQQIEAYLGEMSAWLSARRLERRDGRYRCVRSVRARGLARNARPAISTALPSWRWIIPAFAPRSTISSMPAPRS